MKHCIAALSLGVLVASAMPAVAGSEIERACLRADRAAASKALCGCIQDVAEAMLTSGERRRVVKFFRDPHLTQDLRASSRRADERFWERYVAFGRAARKHCG